MSLHIVRRFPERPLAIDLFAGAGGAAMGYWQAGFEVIGVDIINQRKYPFQLIQADATAIDPDWLHEHATIVHASPPCQHYSITKSLHSNKHPALIKPTREILIASTLPYVIENVEEAGWALVSPVKLCGSSFGLRVRRHRLFESNQPVRGSNCDHKWQDDNPCYRIWVNKNRTDNGSGVRLTGIVPVHGGNHMVGGGQLQTASVAMGIDWMNLPELNEAIPPAYTLYLGRQLKRMIGNE